MKPYLNYCVLILIAIFASVSAQASDNRSYWQCSTHDQENKEWLVKNSYQKMALNLAYEACKKESQYPATCKASTSSCEGFYMGMSTKPLWRCTALDTSAQPWQSNFYSQRDDAALAAKAYCKENSNIPETCYINMVTCKNFNEEFSFNGL